MIVMQMGNPHPNTQSFNAERWTKRYVKICMTWLECMCMLGVRIYDRKSAINQKYIVYIVADNMHVYYRRSFYEGKALIKS